jgi:hypothetical protein
MHSKVPIKQKENVSCVRNGTEIWEVGEEQRGGEEVMRQDGAAR